MMMMMMMSWISTLAGYIEASSALAFEISRGDQRLPAGMHGNMVMLITHYGYNSLSGSGKRKSETQLQSMYDR
jgi:hypothetical protein